MMQQYDLDRRLGEGGNMSLWPDLSDRGLKYPMQTSAFFYAGTMALIFGVLVLCFTFLGVLRIEPRGIWIALSALLMGTSLYGASILLTAVRVPLNTVEGKAV